jgi:hypothetical protein
MDERVSSCCRGPLARHHQIAIKAIGAALRRGTTAKQSDEDWIDTIAATNPDAHIVSLPASPARVDRCDIPQTIFGPAREPRRTPQPLGQTVGQSAFTPRHSTT